MSDLVMVLVVSWAAGLTAVVGGLIAWLEPSRETEGKGRLVHAVVALGGGILLAAIALALVPEGLATLDVTTLTLTFCAGGVTFALVDAALHRHGGGASQLLAMVMDFVPEALSLCAVFAQSRNAGILLAAFIGAQNLPEGFNAFRELASLKFRPKVALTGLLAASFLGPIAALTGHLFLQGQRPLTAAIMVFAAGGILYLIFQDIAPQAKMRRHWSPPLAAVLGFALGMLGKKLLS